MNQKNVQSDMDILPIGVPQDSILGLLLFTIYINDLPNYLNHWDVTLYADDTVLYVSSKSVYTIESELNSDLNILNWWLTLNQLSLNISKSKFIIIGTCSNQRLSNVDSISVTVDDKPIEEVIKFLYILRCNY